MSGFWAGAVPPWAYVVGGGLGLALLFVGMWYGYGRGWKHCKEDQAWAREQAKARRTHPVYRQPPEVAHDWLIEGLVHEWHDHPPLKYGDEGVRGCPACEARWECPPVAAITTGEIQAITSEMDAWLAEHVYSAPTDYGAWLQQVDGHGTEPDR